VNPSLYKTYLCLNAKPSVSYILHSQDHLLAAHADIVDTNLSEDRNKQTMCNICRTVHTHIKTTTHDQQHSTFSGSHSVIIMTITYTILPQKSYTSIMQSGYNKLWTSSLTQVKDDGAKSKLTLNRHYAVHLLKPRKNTMWMKQMSARHCCRVFTTAELHETYCALQTTS